MGQQQVYGYLKEQRESGNHSFLSPNDVKKALKSRLNGCGLHGIPGDLRRLEVSGFLEGQCKGKWNNWRRVYRLRKQYIKGK